MPRLDDEHVTAMEALAARYTDAFTRGDVEGMRACYAPGARIEQMVTGRTLEVDQSLEVVSWLHRMLPGLWVEDARMVVTTEGFVQQYVIRGRTAGGTEVRSPTCLVVRADGGLIAHIAEYFDRVATEPISG